MFPLNPPLCYYIFNCELWGVPSCLGNGKNAFEIDVDENQTIKDNGEQINIWSINLIHHNKIDRS